MCTFANTAEQNLLLFYRIKPVFLKAGKKVWGIKCCKLLSLFFFTRNEQNNVGCAEKNFYIEIVGFAE